MRDKDEADELLDAALAACQALGIVPIAGGDGELGEGGEAANETDDDAAPDDADDDHIGEDDDDEGDEEVDEDADEPDEDDDADDDDAGDEDDDDDDAELSQKPRGRANERIRELSARARRLEETNQLLLKRLGVNGSTGEERPKPWAVPEEYSELDKNMGGYIKAYLNPLAGAFSDFRSMIVDQLAIQADESRFYRMHPEITAKQASRIETAFESLNQRLGKPGQPILREDVLLYLRGHPKYGKHFVAKEVKTKKLADAEAAGRRKAGKVGGRPATKASGERKTPDLSSMTPAQRIKYFETEMADAPI